MCVCDKEYHFHEWSKILLTIKLVNACRKMSETRWNDFKLSPSTDVKSVIFHRAIQFWERLGLEKWRNAYFLSTWFIIYPVRNSRHKSSQHGPSAICVFPIITNKLRNIVARSSAPACAKFPTENSPSPAEFPTREIAAAKGQLNSQIWTYQKRERKKETNEKYLSSIFKIKILNENYPNHRWK